MGEYAFRKKERERAARGERIYGIHHLLRRRRRGEGLAHGAEVGGITSTARAAFRQKIDHGNISFRGARKSRKDYRTGAARAARRSKRLQNAHRSNSRSVGKRLQNQIRANRTSVMKYHRKIPDRIARQSRIDYRTSAARTARRSVKIAYPDPTGPPLGGNAIIDIWRKGPM